jgi:hypothetical protein
LYDLAFLPCQTRGKQTQTVAMTKGYCIKGGDSKIISQEAGKRYIKGKAKRTKYKLRELGK